MISGAARVRVDDHGSVLGIGNDKVVGKSISGHQAAGSAGRQKGEKTNLIIDNQEVRNVSTRSHPQKEHDDHVKGGDPYWPDCPICSANRDSRWAEMRKCCPDHAFQAQREEEM